VLVCHCNVVSDRAVRAAISAGATDVAQVTALSGAGGECGGCVPSIEQLLEDAGIAVARPDVLVARQRQRRPVPSVAAVPALATAP
jgi:bacterioferritin-associated ferredoxin